MTLAGVKLETLVSEPDALTTRPSPYAFFCMFSMCVHVRFFKSFNFFKLANFSRWVLAKTK